MPAGTERITFDIDGDSQSLVDAVRRAAESLRNLSVQITQEQAKAVAGDRAVEASNQGVASSYQQMAATAATAAAEQVAAVRQTEQANRDAASVAEASAAAQEDAAQKVVRAYGEEAVAAQASAAAQEAAAVKARAAQAAAAAPVRPGVPTGGGSTTVVTRGGGTNVVGVRSPRNPGSITNPIVMVMEAARFTGMGGMAAAIGETSAGGGASENRSQVQQSLAGADPLLAAIAQSEGSQASQSATSTQANLEQTTLLQEIRDLLAAGALGSGRGGGDGGNRTAVVRSPGGGDRGGRGGGDQGGVPWGRLLFGGGIAGLAGAGTLGDFAGLGFVHALATALGLAASLATAFAGLGTIAAGAFGTMAVGAGSDIAVMKETFSNVKTLNTALENLSNAQAQYGANSKQAQQAQQALNGQMRILAADVGPAAARAELQVAQAFQAMANNFSHSTAQAQIVATQIMKSLIQVANAFVPLIAQAAVRNLSIIRTGLQPLFDWLRGPEGLGIFQNLENNFASNLPTAIHAFTQAVEVALRFISLASNYTGGFTRQLDSLFTRLNSLDNFQLNSVIQRLVADFRLWETFVKLLIVDIADLFRNASGTGNSIIATLNGMLEKLHQWENSVQGRADLTNIFLVHKKEIDALLQVLPLLVRAFAPIYMTVAPPLTAALTAILRVIAGIARAIESFPGGTWALGLTLIAAKLGILVPLLRAAAGAMGLMNREAAAGGLAGAAGKAAGAAAGAGEGAAAGGVASKLGSILPAGLAGALGGVTSSLAMLGRMLLPGGLVVLGLTALVKDLNLVPAPTEHSTRSVAQLTQLLQGQGTAALNEFVGKQGGPTGLWSFIPGAQAVANALGSSRQSVQQFLTSTSQGKQILGAWVTQADSMSKVAKLSTTQLSNLVTEGEGLAKAFAGTKFEPLIQKFLQPLQKEAQSLGSVFNTITDRWFEVAGAAMPRIVDVFRSNMRLIASTVGLESAHGRQAMAQNLQMMVTDTTRSMLSGKVTVTAGMAAIRTAMQEASKAGVTNVEANYRTMFATLTTLYQKGKIDAQTYFTNIEQLGKNLSRATVTSALAQWQAYIQHQGQLFQQGKLTAQQYLQNVQSAFVSYTHKTASSVESGYQGMFAQLAQMYDKHKISTQQMQADVLTLWKQGDAAITSEINQAKSAQLQILQTEYKQGLIDKQQYDSQVHQLQVQSNQQAHQDMTQWAQQILGGMIAGQKTSLSGVDAIAKQLNTLLSSVGASKIPIPTGISVGQGLANIGSAVGHAHGGLVQVGERGAAGRDTIPMTVGGADIMVGAGEQVAVFNRHQQTVANQMLAPVGGLGGLFEKVRTPHYMSTGGYVYPIAPGVPIGRTDQGVDPLAPAGKPFGPIGDAVIHSTSIGGWPGGPYMFWQLTNGPMAGRYVYLAEEIRPTVSPGQHVTAHQAVAISTGPSQEMGWATASGETLARATSGYGEGQVTPAGASFRAFLTGLSHGQIVGGGVGFASITAPHVQGHGLIAEMVQKSLDKGTSAANTYAMKKFAALAPAGGSFTGSFVSNGPVEARIAADAGRVGINKIGIAGIIGNAAQESGINPASVGSGGGGLFGFTPLGPEQAFAASRHTAWTDVDTQMAFMLNQWFGQDSSAVSSINASGSPGAAAAYFMNTYERPYAPAANLANREAQAQAAYAAGYQRGGFLPLMMAGGGSPGGGPHHHHHSREPGGANLWDFIHHVSPTFPVRDLGAKVLEWMADSMNFGRPKPHQVGAEMVQDVVERTGDIIHKWVPKMQGREHQLYRQWSRAGMPGGKPYTKLQGLDQHIVAWLLRAAHANERLIGGPGEDGPLDEHIANMEHAHARGSQINLFKRHRATLSSQLSKVLGKGGSGGMLDSAERHLEHVIGGPALLQLYQQKIQQLSEELALQRMDLRVFDSVIDQITGAGGMGGLTTLPAFAHGGPVLSTGLALVHRGEWVSPDPQGPYGNVQRPVAVSSPSPPVNVYLVGKAASLDEIIDCRVEYGIARRAPGVVSRHLGRRGRALTRAPGTTPLTVTARGR